MKVPRSTITESLLAHLEHLKDENVSGLDIGTISSTLKIEVSENPVQDTRNEITKLQNIRNLIGNCTICPLHINRHSIVFGDGNPNAELVFVGEGPGHEEDIQGIPFVGKAGGLLNRIINAMGLSRESIYICNIVKCRPPGNRNPDESEIAMCTPFLDMQLTAIQPRIICALGNTAAGYLTGEKMSMAALRGRNYEYKGIPVRPTYHPAAVLRNSLYRRPVWEDVQEIMKFLSKPV